MTITVALADTVLTATSAEPETDVENRTATWSVSIPANADYITGASIELTVSATKSGFTPPNDIQRVLTVELTAPVEPSYTVPAALIVGTGITAMTPSPPANDGIATYEAIGLPTGLSIDASTGVIGGAPDSANPSIAEATVTITDSAGNTTEINLTFPAVTADEEAIIMLSMDLEAGMIGEKAGATMVKVTADLDGQTRAAPIEITVSVGMDGDSAVEGADYDEVADFRLTIASDATAGTETFTLIPVDDEIDEENETLTLTGTVETAGLTVMPEGGLAITIEDDDEPGVEVDKEALARAEAQARSAEFVLAGFGRSIGQNVVELVGERARTAQGFGIGGSYATVAGKYLDLDTLGFGELEGEGAAGWVRAALDVIGVNAENPDGLTWELVRRTGLAGGYLNLDILPDARDLLPVSSFELALDGESGPGTWAMWGRGNITGFQGRPSSDFSMDGEVLAGHIGLDRSWSEKLLTGVFVSRSTADVNYRLAHGSWGEGQADLLLTSIHPYLYWSPGVSMDFWVTLGGGQGTANFSAGTGAEGTDIDMRMAALGSRRELLGEGGFALALKADAFFVQMTAGEQEDLAGVTADSLRVRLAVESQRLFELTEDSMLMGSVELGALADGGSAETGVGAELTVSLDYMHPAGLGIQAQGNVLLAHEAEEFESWGASLAASFDLGVPGEGLSILALTTWGQMPMGAEGMWSQERGLQVFGMADSEMEMALETRVGYGMRMSNNGGLFTPFAELRKMGGSPPQIGLGAELARLDTHRLASRIEIYGERVRSNNGDPSHYAIQLTARGKF